MKVIRDAHLYELESMEGTFPQRVQFIEKEERYRTLAAMDKTFVTVNDGTTNEEVLKMLIDRCKKLGEKLPCRENSIAVTKLEEALMWFEKRTANRLMQGVENTPLPHKN